MIRPANPSAPPNRPGAAQKEAGKPVDWSQVKPGQVFSANRAPVLTGGGFFISATIESRNPEGVIVAHGGSVVGYSLYAREGEAVFAIRHPDRGVARIAVPLSNGESSITARLLADGTLEMSVNGRTRATAQGTGRLARHPSEALCIGLDDRNPVDEESPEGRFQGRILDLRVAPMESEPERPREE